MMKRIATMLRYFREILIVAVLAALSGCDLPLDTTPPGATAHARIDAVVLTSAGAPAAGLQVSVREMRPTLPYQFNVPKTNAAGEAAVTIWRLGGPAPAGQDSVSFWVIASAAARRDSVSVVVLFAPTREAVPATPAKLTLSAGG